MQPASAVTRAELATGAAHAVGGYAVLVDRCHPFAATIDTDGSVRATASWAALVSPPNAWHHPRRRLLHLDATSVAVHDVGTAIAARLAVGRDGSLDVQPIALASLTWPTEQYLPLWRARTPPTPGPGWLLGTDLRQTRWCWWATHPAIPAPEHGADGSILAWATLSDTVAVAAVQHTHKRPFDLRPRVSLRLFDIRRRPSRVLPAVPLPTTARWRLDHRRLPTAPASTLSAHEHSAAAKRADALSASRAAAERDAHRLLDRGYTDARVTLPDGPGAHDPRVVLDFGSPDHPGRLFRRVDHPLDELGNPGGGLNDLTVILEEDLDAGLVDEIARRDPDADLVYI
ncbi:MULTISPECIES: hypothetical protein [unclassified Pseudonocardia]|uniref:hypothetical protein n=1 Tax=unclassified Pseudonocardia TaxID=2619320 RepID=UPI000AFBADF3|nr:MULTISPECIES: hypothetical protein [unclassified Pseudonocardia]